MADENGGLKIEDAGTITLLTPCPNDGEAPVNFTIEGTTSDASNNVIITLTDSNGNVIPVGVSVGPFQNPNATWGATFILQQCQSYIIAIRAQPPLVAPTIYCLVHCDGSIV
jgi:hypothetical protein